MVVVGRGCVVVDDSVNVEATLDGGVVTVEVVGCDGLDELDSLIVPVVHPANTTAATAAVATARNMERSLMARSPYLQPPAVGLGYHPDTTNRTRHLEAQPTASPRRNMWAGCDPAIR